jgi:hypothetical protein
MQSGVFLAKPWFSLFIIQYLSSVHTDIILAHRALALVMTRRRVLNRSTGGRRCYAPECEPRLVLIDSKTR